MSLFENKTLQTQFKLLWFPLHSFPPSHYHLLRLAMCTLPAHVSIIYYVYIVFLNAHKLVLSLKFCT